MRPSMPGPTGGWRARLPSWMRWRLRVRPRRCGPKALDIACGAGGTVAWLAQRGWQVTGVDISTTALAIAQAPADGGGAAGPSHLRAGGPGQLAPGGGQLRPADLFQLPRPSVVAGHAPGGAAVWADLPARHFTPGGSPSGPTPIRRTCSRPASWRRWLRVGGGGSWRRRATRKWRRCWRSGWTA